jgi:DNA-binding NarL/FixJ family response regulator
MLRIFIVDDHPILGMALRDLLLARYPDLEVKLFSRLAPSLEYARFERPDLVILDAGLPDGDPETVISTALEDFHSSGLMVLSGNDRVLEELAPLHPDIEFLSKSVSQDRLFTILESALNQVRRASWAQQMTDKPGQLSSDMAVSQRISRITDRQIVVLHRIAKGESNHEIARALNLSPETVKTHVRSILARLNARNRLEAAMLYRNWKEPKVIDETAPQ